MKAKFKEKYSYIQILHHNLLVEDSLMNITRHSTWYLVSDTLCMLLLQITFLYCQLQRWNLDVEYLKATLANLLFSCRFCQKLIQEFLVASKTNFLNEFPRIPGFSWFPSSKRFPFGIILGIARLLKFFSKIVLQGFESLARRRIQTLSLVCF